jgi:protein-arginine kinase activator protein McsA
MTPEEHQKILYGSHFNGVDKPLVKMPDTRKEVVCEHCCYMFKQEKEDDIICPDCWAAFRFCGKWK